MEKVLLLDHHDSFIYNIVAWLGQNLTVHVLNVDQFNLLSADDFNALLEKEKYLGIILSPGPKSPFDYQESLELEKKYRGPILGICLGFQMMLVNKGKTLSPYTPPLHGKTSHLLVEHPLFEELTMPLEVARYHSLGFQNIPKNEHILAFDESSHLPMIYFHPEEKRLAFQFHPESFLTKESDKLALLVTKWFHSAKASKEVHDE